MTSTLPSPERQRRLAAAPVGLLLLGWGLGLGPLAHAVIAHGDLVPRDSRDAGWVQHASGAHGRDLPPRESTPHHHAPGALEHLQLAMATPALSPPVVAVLLAVRSEAVRVGSVPALPRWWLPEVPGAP